MGATGQKTIEVGILLAPQITFVLDGPFGAYTGTYTATVQDGVLRIDGIKDACDRYVFEPSDTDASFVLKDVVIGIDFHWERKEAQRFKGSLVLLVEEGMVRAVNVLAVEDYLISVIASEMSATAVTEYLKAHAVISRSWLLSQIIKRESLGLQAEAAALPPSERKTDTEWIKWWDREDHTLFDVCADDHCQRYQGITRPSQSLEKVTGAVMETAGEVLVFEDAICDARFSKCCGGFMERFSACWEDMDYPYLQGKYDGASFPENIPVPDLTDAVQAEVWIQSTPDAYCNTDDKKILSQVLNDYDQETTAFYRWEVSYKKEELGSLIKDRIGVDVGVVEDLIPWKEAPRAALSGYGLSDPKKRSP